ncbi:MAG: 50S ribosomal protein L17 [Patescibacteria group bacterium]
MRKRVFGRQLSRERGSRNSLFRGLIANLLSKRSIITTKAKAKAIQAGVDKLITLAKKGTLSARRLVLGRLGNNRVATDTLFNSFLLLAKGRNSGFTRIVNLPRRLGDNSEIVRIEFVDKDENSTTQNKRS